MQRDFTYIDDLVKAIHLLIDTVPKVDTNLKTNGVLDSTSPVAPLRIFNIGNS